MKLIHVTEITVQGYDVPAIVRRSEVVATTARGEPDSDGVFDVHIDFEGYEADEVAGSEEDFEGFIDEATAWFEERGSEIQP